MIIDTAKTLNFWTAEIREIRYSFENVIEKLKVYIDNEIEEFLFIARLIIKPNHIIGEKEREELQRQKKLSKMNLIDGDSYKIWQK